MKKILSDRQGGATYNFKQENKIKSYFLMMELKRISKESAL